jgi:Ca2+-binding EF-hand superfamily protein
MRTYYVLGLLLVASAGAASAQAPGGIAPPTFDGLDTDKNGSLSPAEVAKWVATLPGTLNPRDVFDLWDENSDGSVSRQEFDNRPRPAPGGGPTR